MTEKIRIAWSHNDDTTVRYVCIDKAVLDAISDEAERTEFINQAIWERISEIGWDILEETPAANKLLFVRVTWRVDGDYGERVTYVEQEAYNACKSPADKEDLVCERVGEAFRGLEWRVLKVEENVNQHVGGTSDATTTK